MFGIEKDFQNLMEQVYGPLNKDKMTKEIDISKVLIEGDTATIMGVKYKRIEEPKSPVEEAYYEWWGEYPGDENWTSDATRWQGFQAGYNAAYEEKVSEWQPTPQTPEETEQSLKEAFVEAQKTERWKEIQKLIDEEDNDKNFKNTLDLIREWGEKNKPPTLYQILWEWWEDLEDTLDMDSSIDYLVDMIDKKFIPPSSEKNTYDWERCLKRMREKLR